MTHIKRIDEMKYEFDTKSGTMQPKEKDDIEVSSRIGGIMVICHKPHIQFFIEFGSDKINRCIGCTPDNVKVFSPRDARIVADKIRRIAYQRNTSSKYSDYKLLTR